MEEKIVNKQDEFQKVLDQNIELSYEVTMLQKKMRALKSNQQEKIKTSAMMGNELNGKAAEFLKLRRATRKSLNYRQLLTRIWLS